MPKLNLGCGANKIPGFVNIDTEPSCNPDKVCNFITEKLPYKTNSVSEVVLFHTIEHIGKRSHGKILGEIWRVLKPGGLFLVSYPEFIRCVENWKKNYRGQRDFWEATIFGRQLYPSDYHVCAMHSEDFRLKLQQAGFGEIEIKPEPIEKHNTIVNCKKGLKTPMYEDLIREDMGNFKLNRISPAK